MANFTIIHAPQRSPEWFAARAGRLTGSKAWAAIDFTKTKGESAYRRDYRFQLMAERLSGLPEPDGFINAEMQRGIDKEPEAVIAYQELTKSNVNLTGFLSHTSLMAGCSLDAHIGNFEGIVEVKCPKTATHCKYLRMGGLPADYVAQVTHNLWISGAEWCDFVSYDDRLPANMRVFVHRVKRTDVNIPEYEAAALKFLEEVDREVASMRGWSLVGAA
jgi:hypothetical protein